MSEEKGKSLWTGHLKRGDAPGTVVGFLQDEWQWGIEITGTLSAEGGYVLEGRTGAPPESLIVPIVDDPITKDG